MTDLAKLIEKARARVQTPISETLNIVLGGDDDGELVPVEVEKLPGHEWLMLKALHPPRPGVIVDANVGCNLQAIPADYPIERIKVAGQQIPAEQWREILALIDAVHQENIADLMLGLNVAVSMLQLDELGKALSGDSQTKQNSPESSASRPDDSEGGSPQK